MGVSQVYGGLPQPRHRVREVAASGEHERRPSNGHFERAVHQHEPALQAVALRLARNRADAQDLVQDALERGLRRAASLPPGANVRAWLLTVLHNLFIDQCRRRKRAPRGEPISPAADVPAPERVAPPAWLDLDPEQVRAAIGRLDPVFREVYALRAVRGMSYQEIADRLGIEKNTVGSRLHRARRALRELLEAELAAQREVA